MVQWWCISKILNRKLQHTVARLITFQFVCIVFCCLIQFPCLHKLKTSQYHKFFSAELLSTMSVSYSAVGSNTARDSSEEEGSDSGEHVLLNNGRPASARIESYIPARKRTVMFDIGWVFVCNCKVVISNVIEDLSECIFVVANYKMTSDCTAAMVLVK